MHISSHCQILCLSQYYVDGGISDNLPQHFKEGETITVSPFSGEHDICPKDVSSNDAHIELRKTSIQITCNNLNRLASALFPPDETGLSDICRQGYRDTLRFLKEHCKFLSVGTFYFILVPPYYQFEQENLQQDLLSEDISLNNCSNTNLIKIKINVHLSSHV